MENQISRPVSSLVFQSKEGIDNIKSRYLSETAFIKAELQRTMEMVKKIDQDQRRPMESLKKGF